MSAGRRDPIVAPENAARLAELLESCGAVVAPLDRRRAHARCGGRRRRRGLGASAAL